MERIFRLHYRHTLDAKATKAIRGEIQNFDEHGRTEVLHFHAVRQLRQHYIRNKQYGQARDLLRLVTGTLWTPARITNVFGHHTACTMCGQDNANSRHILFDCPGLSMDRQHIFNSQNLLMHEEDWEQPCLDRGLFVVPRSLRAAPRAGSTEVFEPAVPATGTGPTFFEPNKPIYLDESAFFADDPNFARAGMAALQHTDGRITASWSSPVPAPYAATAAVGAQMAAARCTQLSYRPHLIVDCSAIVANATKPNHACYYKNPAAGFWRLIQQARWPKVDKTKAHRTKEQAEAEDDLTNWTGNDLVDEAAKAIALQGDQPEVIGRISAFRTKTVAMLKSLVGLVKAYRKPDIPQTLTAQRAHSQGRTPVHEGHHFIDVEGPTSRFARSVAFSSTG